MSPMPKYYRTIQHDGLGKSKVISGTDPDIVDHKAAAQLWEWECAWDRIQEREEARAEKESNKEEAAVRTKEAQDALAEVDGLLAFTIGVNDTVDWETLKNNSPFSKPVPVLQNPQESAPICLPGQPQEGEHRFQPNLGFFDRIIPSWAKAKREVAAQKFEQAIDAWKQACVETGLQNEAAKQNYAEAVIEAKREHERQTELWLRERDRFEEKRANRNAKVEKRRSEYYSCTPEAIADYCDLVLSNSQYPGWMTKEFDIDYLPETRIVVVDYRLPTPTDLPALKEVRFVAQSEEFKETALSESERNRLYDTAIYQIVLRSIHELFEADAVGAIDAAVFNGWVQFVDKSVGKETKSCIVSLQASKTTFSDINLASVDPKACFKSLKGVGSAKLHGMAAVPPILQISREDRRFVTPQSVASVLDESFNVAAMDWEEFEHLVRELFAQEFSSGGGEVKITRASRDGGVDAVAFDPDPIRGGKIVIQAKRYTNTVGVAAVRDLYGTVINEGATKGILITTSDYGPDAFEFAKGKPLTLLSGGNLLHLLAKHGHRARIDLKEAREKQATRPTQ